MHPVRHRLSARNTSQATPPLRWTVPETTDKEKKNPVVDKDSLCGLAPDFNRCEAVFERNSLKVVEIDILGDELFDL